MAAPDTLCQRNMPARYIFFVAQCFSPSFWTYEAAKTHCSGTGWLVWLLLDWRHSRRMNSGRKKKPGENEISFNRNRHYKRIACFSFIKFSAQMKWFCLCSASRKMHIEFHFFLCARVLLAFFIWFLLLFFFFSHFMEFSWQPKSSQTIVCSNRLIIVVAVLLFINVWNSNLRLVRRRIVL